MGDVLAGLSVIAAVIALGYTLGRRKVLGPEGQRVLGRVAFFVATPCLLFGQLSAADVAETFSSLLIVTAGAAGAVAAAYVVVARFVWRRPTADTTIGALAAGYVNANAIGIPISVYVLGDASYAAQVILFQVVIAAPIAFAVLDVATTGHGSWQRTLLGPFTNPMIVASLAGVAVSITGVNVPDAVMRPVDLVAGMAIPGMLLAYGLSLTGAKRPGSGETGREVWLVVVLKSVVHPVAAYTVARFALGLDGTALLAATVMAALPTAQNVFVASVRYDRGVVLARDAVLITTVAAVPVLLLVATLVG